MSDHTPRTDIQSPKHLAAAGGPGARMNVLSYELGRLRQTLPLLVSRCMAYSAMSRFDDELIAAVKEFYGLELDVATAEAEILEEEDERVRFFPWFLWDWRSGAGGGKDVAMRTIGERYMDEPGHGLHELKLLQALCASYVGFYEALEDASAVGVRLRDLASGEILRVSDEGLAGDVFSGHIVQARLLRIPASDGPCVLVDAIYATLPPEARPAIQVELESLGATDGDPAACLKTYVAEMLHFADHLLETLARPPEADNGDGDPMILSRSRLAGADAATVTRALAAGVEGFSMVEPGLWQYAPLGAPRGFVDARSQRRVVLAANSPTRLEALEAAISGATEVTRPALRSLEEFTSAVQRWAEHGGGDTWLRLDPDVPRAVAEWFTAWVRQWLDMPSPMLGDRTPREAVGHTDGRRRVEALLSRFERLQLGTLAAAADEAVVTLEHVRLELGL